MHGLGCPVACGIFRSRDRTRVLCFGRGRDTQAQRRADLDSGLWVPLRLGQGLPSCSGAPVSGKLTGLSLHAASYGPRWSGARQRACGRLQNAQTLTLDCLVGAGWGRADACVTGVSRLCVSYRARRCCALSAILWPRPLRHFFLGRRHGGFLTAPRGPVRAAWTSLFLCTHVASGPPLCCRRALC